MNDAHTTNVAALRIARGWSQMKLATEAGLSLPTVQRAEKGKRDMQYGTAMKLARALDVDPSDIAPYVDAPTGIFTNDAPAWAQAQDERAERHHAELLARIDRLETALRTRRRGA
jgi:transcriptional regulator with XRE-family HTH domain